MVARAQPKPPDVLKGALLVLFLAVVTFAFWAGLALVVKALFFS